MSDRSFGNLMPYRQGISWRTYDLINRRTCIHVDAWLYQDTDDTLYLYVEYSAGGRQLIYKATWRVDVIARELVPTYTLEASDIARMITRHVNSPYMRRWYPTVAAMSDAWLDRMYADMGSAFTGYRSVALHYVWTDARISEPMAGLHNDYNDTRRADRDDALSAAPMPVVREKPPKLPPRERSIMRTLDKVLRGPNST